MKEWEASSDSFEWWTAPHCTCTECNDKRDAFNKEQIRLAAIDMQRFLEASKPKPKFEFGLGHVANRGYNLKD